MDSVVTLSARVSFLNLTISLFYGEPEPELCLQMLVGRVIFSFIFISLTVTINIKNPGSNPTTSYHCVDYNLLPVSSSQHNWQYKSGQSTIYQNAKRPESKEQLVTAPLACSVYTRLHFGFCVVVYHIYHNELDIILRNLTSPRPH